MGVWECATVLKITSFSISRSLSHTLYVPLRLILSTSLSDSLRQKTKSEYTTQPSITFYFVFSVGEGDGFRPTVALSVGVFDVVTHLDITSSYIDSKRFTCYCGRALLVLLLLSCPRFEADDELETSA